MTILVDDLVPDELWALVKPLLAAPPRPPYGGRHRTISDPSESNADLGLTRPVRIEGGALLVSDRRSPHGVTPAPHNIRAGIVAYAADDALGVPWEGRTPDEVLWEALEELPARGDWPQGATSDDTEQLMLVAEYLVEANGQVDERDFLTRLAKALPRVRGAGPTTQAAVRRLWRAASCTPPAAAASVPPCGRCRSAGQPRWSRQRLAGS